MIRRNVRPKRESTHMSLVKEADKWVSAIVSNRQNSVCLRCKQFKSLQGAHILRKGGKYNRIRHDLENVVGMCNGCHIGWAHHNEYDFYCWIEEIFPGRLDTLKQRALFSPVADLKELICVLRSIYQKETYPCSTSYTLDRQLRNQ